MSSSLDGSRVTICCLKSYGDFRYLYEFIKETQLDLGANTGLPELPDKHNPAGAKRDTEDMMDPI